MRRRAPIAPLVVSPFASLVLALTGCSGAPQIPTTEPPPQSISVVEGPRDPSTAAPSAEKPRGVGWYPNIEVTSDNRLVLAWVDADRGDVRMAVTVAGGSAFDGPVVPVDTEGAVGGFLRLSLAPGDVPVFSYVRQDKQLLRLAFRPADRARMKAAGAEVDTDPMPAFAKTSTAGAPIEVQSGFVAEEVGFGEQVGRGSALTVDGRGRFVLVYYAADDRLRLARRPVDLPAFGATSTGVLEKRDVDAAAGSIRVLSDVVVLDDGTIVVSYAHDVVTDARLRIAVLKPGADRFVVVTADDGPAIALDGLVSDLHPRPTKPGEPRILDVTALDKSERGVFVRAFDVDACAFVGERQRIVDVDGTAIARRTKTGWLVLARVRGAGGGVFLYVVDEKKRDDAVTLDTRRIRLGDGGDQDDTWLDLVVRPDGRPAAVWFDAAAGALQLYAP